MSRLAVIITDPETTLITFSPHISYRTYISRVFNFVNLESFTKLIQLKFEPLHCHTHGQHEFVDFSQQLPSKQLYICEHLGPRNISAIWYIVRELVFTLGS